MTEPKTDLAAYLASLPVDAEPLSDAEVASIEAGRAAAARGEFASAEEVAAIVDAP